MTEITPPAAQPPHAPQPSAIEALVAMDLRLAGLTAAVDGFAARQQELHARDYSPELAAIHERWERAREAFDRLAARPAIALSPTAIAEQIEKASETVRKADHDAFNAAGNALLQAVGTIDSVVASAKVARDQKRRLAGTAAATIVLGYILGAIVPAAIDRAVPASWLWPEQRAAGILGQDGWNAGQRLLQTSDPDRWQGVVAAVTLSSQNVDTLAKCAGRAAKAREARSCTIMVAPDGMLPSTNSE